MTRAKLVAAILPLFVGAIASAAVVFTTLGPFGGFFGLWGADLNPQQRVAERFIPTADHTLDDARVWLMNNSGSTYGAVTLRLELDATEVGLAMGTGDEPGVTWLWKQPSMRSPTKLGNRGTPVSESSW